MMNADSPLPRYDPARSYEWNYEHVPPPVEIDVPSLPGDWSFCGLPVGSPLGIPAGPLLNGRWILYYASMGFDVLTYKTVRSRERVCYDLPNLQPVDSRPLSGGEAAVAASSRMAGSWAVSYGMPSRAPDVWRADIESTRRQLPRGKLLSVSVVGTVQEGWSIDNLARDYAQCARWAVESGADCVEANFSCPNVATCDGQLYQDHASARLVTATIRQAIGRVPLVIKVGHVMSRESAEQLVLAIGNQASALSMVNTVATTVRSADGTLMFAGQRRGIAGDAIREPSLAQTRLFADVILQQGSSAQIVGVGGIATAADVVARLAAGAHAVQIATAAMLDPSVGLAIRRDALLNP